MSSNAPSPSSSVAPPTAFAPDQPIVQVADARELGRFVESAPAAMIALDASFGVIAASDRAAAVLGGEARASRNAEGRPSLFDQVHDADDYWQEALTQCMEEHTPVRGEEARLDVRGGGDRWVRWEGRPWEATNTDAGGVLLSIEDQTAAHVSASSQAPVAQELEALKATIEEGVLLIDRSGVFQDCNVQAEHILGRSAEDIVGSSIVDEKWRGIREDGTPLPNESFPFWVALYTNEPVHGEVMGLYPAEGPPRWLRVNVQPLTAPDEEEPYAALATFVDITEQRLSEEALRTSKDLLSSVLRGSLDGIMVLASVRDREGDIVDFEWLLLNPRGEQLIDRTAEELVGERLLDQLPGHDTSGLFDAYTDVVESGEPLEREVYYDWDGI